MAMVGFALLLLLWTISQQLGDSIVMKSSVFDGELLGLTHTIIILEKKWWDFLFFYFFIFLFHGTLFLGRPVDHLTMILVLHE